MVGEGWIGDALDYCIECTRRNASELADFPETASDGCWSVVPGGGWVGGHWVGLLWQAYGLTHAAAFEAAARDWTARLAPRAADAGTHDLGFLFELSHLLGARLTGDDTLAEPALRAAETLCLRYNPKGRYIQAWGALDAGPEWRGRIIVDTMMNLSLLYWAGSHTGDATFDRIASAHARTAQERLVRADFSTAHVADFDPDTGVFLKQDTHQGLSATSCWSRGQAWAVYGCAATYGWTGDPSFLATARGTADYAVRRLPPDRTPYWDYDSPLIPNDVRDSSAGAILAAGLLQLARVEPAPEQRALRRDQASAILRSLWENHSSRGIAEPSILIHGTASKPHGRTNHGLIYGDYYFVEALTRLAAP
jgi:unsaturated chondroitin disaccharide hydrolase